MKRLLLLFFAFPLLALGQQAQRNASFDKLTVRNTATFANLISSTTNPASANFLRLASTDSISWRNNANTQNISVSKDNIDYFHVNGAAWQQDCPAPGVASCSTGNFILSNNDNPGVNGEGFNIDFQQYNSAGVQKQAVVFNCGFPDVTSGAEQGVCDQVYYINGAQKTISVGGLLSGGNLAYFGLPANDNFWNIGKSGQRFASGWFVNMNAAAFFSESANVAQTGGVLRLASSDTINWRNNANSADVVLGHDSSDRLTYNSLPVSISVGVTSQKAETGSADANVLTVTPPATVGTYRACFAASVSSATSGVIGWTLSWTDSNGNAQSNIAQSLFQSGTAAPALTYTVSAAGNYDSCHTFDVNNAAANIVVKWVGGGTSAAKVSASVERIQ